MAKYDIWKPYPTMWVVIDSHTIVYTVTGSPQTGLTVRGYPTSDHKSYVIRSVVEQYENATRADQRVGCNTAMGFEY